MLAGSAFNFDINNQNNWCCQVECNRDAEVVGFRRHQLPKSAQKNQKYQKTSLKKRSGSNTSAQEPKAQTKTQECKQDCTPPKPALPCKQFKPPEPAVIFQQMQLASVQPPTVNFIKYTPERAKASQKKINFIYNNKMPTIRYQALGVTDLDSFKQEVQIIKNQNVSLKKPSANHTTTFNSSTRIDPAKSTQYTNRASEHIGSWDDSPGLSTHFKFDEISPQRRQSQDIFGGLTSRKQTVLSIDGDSQSQQSFAIEDLQPLPLLKFNSNQTSKILQQRQKCGHASLKNSISL